MATRNPQPRKTSHRKLAAILCADMAGHSRLMGADEEATIEFLTTRGVRPEPGVDVARSGGVDAELFTDAQEARDWLVPELR